MRKLSRMMSGIAALAAAATLVAGAVTTASAATNDPPKAVTPAAYDIVGVGSNTTEYVMDQFSVDYNAKVKTNTVGHPYFYSYDALPEGVNVAGNYKIKPKAGCATILRPDGSGAGVTALGDSQAIKYKGGSYECIDFARSSGGRKPTNPGDKPGGVVFVAFAKDAITWAARSAAKGGTDAPASLTLPQLKAIFTCKDTNWSQVGGKAGAIKVYLPQAGSGTLSTWEKFMGITTLGSCVSQAPEENEGTYAGFNSPNAVFIYSIGAYVAQKYHSAACGAKPTRLQNAFRLQHHRRPRSREDHRRRAALQWQGSDDQPQVPVRLRPHRLQRRPLLDWHQGPPQPQAGEDLRRQVRGRLPVLNRRRADNHQGLRLRDDPAVR
jgi:ABC-type phosphate transport system substrate-binding protein